MKSNYRGEECIDHFLVSTYIGEEYKDNFMVRIKLQKVHHSIEIKQAIKSLYWFTLKVIIETMNVDVIVHASWILSQSKLIYPGLKMFIFR